MLTDGERMRANEPRPSLLAVIGPSGSGKSTLVRRLVVKGVVDITPTWTTRLPREDDLVAGVEHRFVTREEFNRLEADGYFSKTGELFDPPERYGLPEVRPRSGASVPLVMLRASLISTLRWAHPEATVYALEARPETLHARLRAAGREHRHHSPLALAEEMFEGRKVAHRVFDAEGTRDELLTQVCAAIDTDFGWRSSAAGRHSKS